MSKNSERICICFRPDELEIFDELCLKKGISAAHLSEKF